MSGITDDCSHSADAALRRLYDPAFKLFGRTIPVSSDSKEAASGEEEPMQASGDTSSIQHANEIPDSEDEGSVPDELGSYSGSNDGCEEEKTAELVGGDLEGPKLHASDLTEEGTFVVVRNTEDEGKEDGTLDQAPKKPDKPVHCPRCKSLDTKFCYFNNYNVNQPRHFCKNCQRYWTAGGTLRNVPVGAGRRKNKHPGAQPRSMLPDVVMVRSDPPDNAQRLLSATPVSSQAGSNRHINTGLPSRHLLPSEVHSLVTLESPSSSAVLSFGQESPVCISTGAAQFAPCRVEVLQGYKPEMSQAQAKRNPSMNVSALAMGVHMDQKASDEKHNKEQNASNEFGANVLKPVLRQPVGERPTEFSQPEVPFTSTPKPEVGGVSDFPKYVDAALAWASSAPFSFMGGPWQYGVNLGWGNAIPAATLTNVAQGASVNPMATLANLAQAATNTCNTAGTKPVQAATFGSQPPWAAAMAPWAGGIPWPLLQNPLWGPPGWGGAWTMPWAAPFTAAAAAAAAATAAAAAAAAAANPDLGSTILGKHPREQSEADIEKVLVPKTLRIDDPGEAARSSIWSTLGIGLRSDTLAAGGIFRDFKSKAESRKNDDPHAQTRSSNPAGLDRSVNFQENNLASSSVDAKDE